MKTPFSDPSFPQIDINANEIVRLQTEIHSNNTLIQQNASNISAVVTTGAFKDSENTFTSKNIFSNDVQLGTTTYKETGDFHRFVPPISDRLDKQISIGGFNTLDNAGSPQTWANVGYRKVLLVASGPGGAVGSPNGDVFLVRGGVFATINFNSSDSRIKENQREFPPEDSMNIVKSIKVKKYFNTEEKREITGFIAQEVEEVLPEVVETHDLSEYGKLPDFKMLNYKKLLIHSFGAIQLLDQKIKDLEERISILESKE